MSAELTAPGVWPVSTMRCSNGGELKISVQIVGREMEMDKPSCAKAAASFRFWGVIKLRVPSWSSFPHRPQFERDCTILAMSWFVSVGRLEEDVNDMFLSVQIFR